MNWWMTTEVLQKLSLNLNVYVIVRKQKKQACCRSQRSLLSVVENAESVPKEVIFWEERLENGSKTKVFYSSQNISPVLAS
jgi:hypothetical protein